jgi:hypothetical protein
VVLELKRAVWLPFILIAGCPGGQSRKNVLVHGGVCVHTIMKAITIYLGLDVHKDSIALPSLNSVPPWRLLGRSIS